MKNKIFDRCASVLVVLSFEKMSKRSEYLVRRMYLTGITTYGNWRVALGSTTSLGCY